MTSGPVLLYLVALLLLQSKRVLQTAKLGSDLSRGHLFLKEGHCIYVLEH